MKTKIYFLRDEQGFVRYVGKTSKSLESRLVGHLREAQRDSKNYRCNGIRSMLKRGFAPTIDLITEVDGDGCKAEMAYIKWFRSKGVELWNGTDGGEGLINPSKEVRERISLANKGRKRSEQTKQKMRNSRGTFIIYDRGKELKYYKYLMKLYGLKNIQEIWEREIEFFGNKT